ncbi:TetM/TetW/TetO/TetS family tetracycline resistance ribosomal protection protein [Cloacibacillus sp. An23]|uniref:GTP-binding protein n=1 Tax=Cloacibacillus sp. An23 TaxID=1965591 RepID=UPI00194FBDD9|nr:TetM/TetW/TetO/TetS family tetracycline resistance ribosomal protection protein [Cloacibacillus sp. An23]
MDRLKRRPLTIGILAHVDAGKTTLTEQMLFQSGAVRSLGRVDDGSAHTDFTEFERRRGISVRAASAFLTWKGAKIYVIDTPGHSDFSGETERAARAMDFAVVAVSAVEGVQAQTEVIWRALSKMGVPALFFINKTDREGADVDSVLGEISELTGEKPVRLPLGDREALAEALAEHDDAALEKYLEEGSESFSAGELDSLLLGCFYDRKLIPYLTGAALKGEGVAELLDALAALAPRAPETEEPPSGVVFKVEHNPTLGRVAHVRLFTGELGNRDAVKCSPSGAEGKITQIREVQGAKERDTGALRAGEVGAVCGLSRVVCGDTFGDPSRVPPPAGMSSPLLRVKLTPESDAGYPALVAALEELSAEDPLLDVIWEKEVRELLVRVTGLMRIETLLLALRERYGMEVSAGEPMVIYKERPLKKGRGFVEYTMPKPCWAVMLFEIEPLPLGSGVVFESAVPDDKIFLRYQAQVRQTLTEALRQGPRGWEVTDLKITLTDGEHHTVHTHPLDFALATPMGIMDGLVNCGTELLEPMLAFRLTYPEEYGGRLIGEILAMRGSFESPVVKKGNFVMEGLLPLATSMDFPARLASLTGGRGTFSAVPAGYAPCPPGEGRDVPYRGVSPLDRAKYILYKRGALGA